MVWMRLEGRTTQPMAFVLDKLWISPKAQLPLMPVTPAAGRMPQAKRWRGRTMRARSRYSHKRAEGVRRPQGLAQRLADIKTMREPCGLGER